MAGVQMETENDYDWQSKKSIVECNRYMLMNKLDSDVTFIVGPTREKIDAHKYVLLSRSCVFHAMFAGLLSGNTGNEIEIPDIKPDIFNMMLLFLYCDEVKLTLDNVLAIHYAAKKYCIQSLIDRCLNKLKANMVPSNVCVIMESAHMFGNDVLKTKCYDLICREPKEVFRSSTFSELCSDCLGSVIKSDNLPIEEKDIFDALLKFSEDKCLENGDDVTPENRRRHLGDVLKYVRFTLMNQDYFVETVEPSGLLSDTECVKILKYFIRPQGACHLFDTKPRKQRFTIERFSETVSGWGYKRQKVDAITITCSADVLFHGVQIYGSDQGPSNYEVNMLLQQRPYMGNLAQKRAEIETDGHQKIYDFLFDNPVQITKDKDYDINLTIRGRTTYYGCRGEKEVGDGNVVFKFKKSDRSTNTTSEDKGQIPGIIYELVPVAQN